MENKIQIVYLSFATRGMKANFAKEIEIVLNKARIHNKEKGITGQLIYRSGIFLQLLEGDKDNVTLLLGRILLDHRRHENIRILLNQAMINRVFPGSNMAYKYLDDSALDLVSSIIPWQKLTKLPSQNKTVSNDDILKIFKELTA